MSGPGGRTAPSNTQSPLKPQDDTASEVKPEPDFTGPPVLGTSVDGLFGLNMLLMRIGFELFGSPRFERWLNNLLHKQLARVKGPGFLKPLVLSRIDLGAREAPQVRSVRAVAGGLWMLLHDASMLSLYPRCWLILPVMASVLVIAAAATLCA